MTDQKLFSAKEFFESEWYKDGLKQLCADGTEFEAYGEGGYPKKWKQK